MELRIPSRLLTAALAAKQIKALRLFAAAKLEGHRSEIIPLCEGLKIHCKTCQRLVKKIVVAGWAGTDGTFLFPRSWKKLKFHKRAGLYITSDIREFNPFDFKKFEAGCFANGLKRIIRRMKKYRKKGSPHSTNWRISQKDFPTRYLCKSLGISERRYERLKSSALSYGFLLVKKQNLIRVGKANEYEALKKYSGDQRLFVYRNACYKPEISEIKVLL